ncbi:MAG: serine protease [Pyrinomonadaceae bacterium]
MPKLGDYRFVLDTVTFIYRTEEQANAGIKAGGTGFFVAVPSEYAPDAFHQIYVVTNVHVSKGERRVLRINTRAGGIDLVTVDEWIYKEDGPDVALAPVDLNPPLHMVEALRFDSWFLTRDEHVNLEIESGEDVFMAGRFVDYDGVQTNRPSLRFGNISMIEAEIKQITGYMGPSVVLDMHSRSGYSGSPVFIYRTGGSIFAKEEIIIGGGHLMKLLGIHWGQFPELWELSDGGGKGKQQDEEDSELLIKEGRYIKGLSGMTCVIPAWDIYELLFDYRLVEHRAEVERQLQK